MTPRQLTPIFWAGGQADAQTLNRAADQGVRRVVNNRPDGEEPGQPDSETVRAWAQAAGLEYHSIPVRGRPGPEQARLMAEAIADGAPTLAFCKSGLRSAAVWAMAAVERGALTPDAARAAAAQAGFDLSGLPL